MAVTPTPCALRGAAGLRLARTRYCNRGAVVPEEPGLPGFVSGHVNRHISPVDLVRCCLRHRFASELKVGALPRARAAKVLSLE